MCCAREKAFCVDDRELMMFGCRWNDSIMCCQIDNANDKWFLGCLVQSESGLALSLDIRIHAIANNANAQAIIPSMLVIMNDVDFSVCGNPEVILGGHVSCIAPRGQIR